MTSHTTIDECGFGAYCITSLPSCIRELFEIVKMPAEKTVQDTWEPSPDPQLDDLSRPDIATIERRILRRLDLSVVPVLCFLFLVSFVDRGNIGNAHIQGLDKSLHMTKNDYNIAVMVFTLGYVVFGLPANFVFKMTGPKSLSVMIFLWGKATT